MRIHMAVVLFVSEHESKEWIRSIVTSAKIPQNYLVTIDTSLRLLQNLRQFYNPHTCLYQSWNVCEDRFSRCWDIQWDRPILPYRFKSTNFSHLNLWRYWTKVDHICTWCRWIICAIHLLIHIAIFQFFFKWMVILPILPKIGCHGNVPWAIKITGPDWQHSRKYLSFGEKIVKIGPVDPERALLKLKRKWNYGR